MGICLFLLLALFIFAAYLFTTFLLFFVEGIAIFLVIYKNSSYMKYSLLYYRYFIYFYFHTLWKEITMYSAFLKCGEFCSTSLRVQYLHKLFEILLHSRFVPSLSIYLFNQSFIYISILYFGYYILFIYLLFFVFQLELTCNPIPYQFQVYGKVGRHPHNLQSDPLISLGPTWYYTESLQYS